VGVCRDDKAGKRGEGSPGTVRLFQQASRAGRKGGGGTAAKAVPWKLLQGGQKKNGANQTRLGTLLRGKERKSFANWLHRRVSKKKEKRVKTNRVSGGRGRQGTASAVEPRREFHPLYPS